MSREYTANTTPVLRNITQNATPHTTVRRQCRQVESIAQKMRDENSKLKAMNDVLNDQIDALKRDVERKHREMVKQKATIAGLRNENYDMIEKSVFETVKQENESLTDELKCLKSHVKNLEKTKKEYETEVQTFRDEMVKLTEELEVSNKRTAELDLVKEERDALVTQCHRFQDKLLVAEQLRQQETQTLQSAYEEKIQQMQEQIDELTENSFSMSGEHIVFHPEPESVPESLSVVNEIMYNELAASVETMKHEYEEQLQELRLQVAQKDETLQQLGKRVAELLNEVSSANIRIKELADQLEQTVREHEMAAGDHASALSVRDETIKSLEQQVAHQSSLITAAEHDNQLLIKDLEEKTEFERLLRIQIDEQTALLSKSETKVRELDDKLSQQEKRIKETCERTEQLSSELQSKTRDTEMLQHQVQEYEKSVSSANTRIVGLEDHVSMLQQEKDAAGATCTELQAQLEDANAALRTKESEILTLISQHDVTVERLQKKTDDQESQIQLMKQELEVLSVDLSEKITSGDAQVADLCQQVTKQLIHCKSSHQTELRRLVSDSKSCQKDLVKKQETELKDLWNLLIGKDATIQKLEEKIQAQETSLQSALSDLKSFSSKVGDMSKSRNEQISRLEDEIRDQRRSCQEVHASEIQRLNEDLKRFNELLKKKESEMQNMREDLQLMEQSFDMERAQKKRYQNECMDLEKKLDMMRNTNAGNNTYIMPTINIGSGSGGQEAATAAAIVNSLSQSHAANSTFDAGRNRRPLPGTSFFVADEPSEVMNSSFISNATEDPFERFSTLWERNKKQPPHLKSCYAAEHQEVAIPENHIRGIPERQIISAMAAGGPNQTFSITDTTTHTRTFHVGNPITNQPMRKPFSPTARSVFRRIRGSWSPKLGKPFSEIPS